MQGRAIGPPRRGLALHCGGVPPRNGWRPTWPGRAAGAALAATCPRLRQQAGRAAPRRRPGWAGIAARRPQGAGGTRPTEGAADGSPFCRNRRQTLPCLISSYPARGRAGGVIGGYGARAPALPVSDRLPPQAAQGATERKRPSSHGWPRAHCQTFPGIEKGQSTGLSFLFANRSR